MYCVYSIHFLWHDDARNKSLLVWSRSWVFYCLPVKSVNAQHCQETWSHVAEPSHPGSLISGAPLLSNCTLSSYVTLSTPPRWSSYVWRTPGRIRWLLFPPGLCLCEWVCLPSQVLTRLATLSEYSGLGVFPTTKPQVSKSPEEEQALLVLTGETLDHSC